MRRSKSVTLISIAFVAISLGTWTVQIVHQRRLDTQLIRAIENNQSDSVAALLKQGADPNARTVQPQASTLKGLLRDQFYFRVKDAAERPALEVAINVDIAQRSSMLDPLDDTDPAGLNASYSILHMLLHASALPVRHSGKPGDFEGTLKVRANISSDLLGDSKYERDNSVTALVAYITHHGASSQAYCNRTSN